MENNIHRKSCLKRQHSKLHLNKSPAISPPRPIFKPEINNKSKNLAAKMTKLEDRVKDVLNKK